jgi:hypothetical protein
MPVILLYWLLVLALAAFMLALFLAFVRRLRLRVVRALKHSGEFSWKASCVCGFEGTLGDPVFFSHIETCFAQTALDSANGTNPQPVGEAEKSANI